MALSSTTARSSFTGAGTTATYAYGFRIFAQTDLLVIVKEIATGDETTLTITTDYTVTGVGETSGGNVVLVDASQDWIDGSGFLTDEYTLSIIRDPSLVQNTDIRNQGTFYPETHEDAFDYQMMAIQRHEDKLDRAVKLPETIIASTFDPELPTDITLHPGSTIVVNAAGDGFSMSAAYFSLYIQSTAPTNPAANALAFWFDQSIDQMKIW
jgi:hypothetical protein